MSTILSPQLDLATCAVVSLRCTEDHRLTLRFSDGLVASLDFADFILSRPGPFIAPLHSPAYFATVTIEDDVLTWPNGYDIDPVILRSWAEQGYVG